MKPRVFVSYSHTDGAVAACLVEHLRGFDDIEVWFDRDIETGACWRDAIERAIDTSPVAVLLLSAGFLASPFIRSTELQWLRDRHEAGEVHIYPVVVGACVWEEVFGTLQTRNAIAGDPQERDRLLTAVAVDIHRLLTGAKPDGERVKFRTEPDAVALELPDTGPYEIFGRSAEIAVLDDAWRSRANVVAVVAQGGTGKTALLNHWLTRMQSKGYGGAELVLGWSFYVQGTRGESVGSSGPFIQRALHFFGDPNPELGAPADKARRLVELIRKRRTLLVLDGMEPLQQRVDEQPEQPIGDEALHILVSALAASNRGLCVITTRFPIAELRRFVGGGRVLQIDLRPLSPAAGADLLARSGVQGERSELEAAAQELGGHSLALTLLGTYLVARCGGDVRKRHAIETLFDGRPADHARRMLASYERILEPRERAFLQLVSLFDRPASSEALATVAVPPPIAHLTEPMFDVRGSWPWRKRTPVPPQVWTDVVRHLRHLALLSPGSAHWIDTHPIIRDYFAESLQRAHPEAWLEAHERLFEYFRDAGDRETSAEAQMRHYYTALHHAAVAGLHELALRTVYVQRVARGEELYSTRKLGLIADDLVALARFFERPWDLPRPNLSWDSRAFVLHQAGWLLMANARMSEARKALLRALAEYKERHGRDTALLRLRAFSRSTTPRTSRFQLEPSAGYAAAAASNLCQLHIVTGDFAAALEYGNESLRLAEIAESRRWLIGARSDLADVLWQTNRPAEALALLREAEAIAGREQLYSFPGHRLWELLLELGHLDEAEERARRGLELAMSAKGLGRLDVGLAHLSLGRAAILRANGSEVTLRSARNSIHAATAEIRDSSRRDYLPRALNALGEVCIHLRHFGDAEAALHESLEIAQPAGMRMLEADAHLVRAQLALARDASADARASYDEARRIVEATGYARRHRDLAVLAERLAAPS